MFKGRRLLVATKHKKESVIAPLLQEALGVECFVAENFDTDTFGTFSGETERKDDPITTARSKCMEAMAMYDCDLGVASEGSFGPHPSLFFLHADEEILIFIDRKNNLEIIVRKLSTETNFGGEQVHTEGQLASFAERAQFPSHALILRKSKEDNAEVIKGIQDWSQLKASFHHLLGKHGTVYVETDMRAMLNPARMKVIGQAAQKLIEKVSSRCPHCTSPGFGVTGANPGLPCECCRYPTRSTLSYIYQCQKCAFIKEEKYPHQKTSEDPMYCDMCNP
ncbi:DUF6671 family protein [Pontibacter pamirensis]|uniref:DUF6671 family protein n=1 Tax=Pontibacter pamirensis TaxID=2562824 RepID=UPI0013899BBF|nr:DUF6671 family protein [Pontibacter pamirensis]